MHAHEKLVWILSSLRLVYEYGCLADRLSAYSYTQDCSQLSHAQTPSGNQWAISFSALSTESLPWQTFLQRKSSTSCVNRRKAWHKTKNYLNSLPANFNAEISTNSTAGTFRRHGGAKHFTLNTILADACSC
jgi:hypothetical protein